MTTFETEALRDVRDRHEVAIRTGRHPDSNVVVWAVVVDDAVFCALGARRAGALVQGPRWRRHGHAGGRRASARGTGDAGSTIPLRSSG